MKTLITFFIITISAINLSAQPYWKNFTTANGLPFNKAFVIAVDDSNRVWYGSNSGFSNDTGLAYFQNNRFYQADVADAGLIYGLKHKDDTLWVVTGSKLLSYNNYNTWQVHDPQPSLGFTILAYSGPLVIDDYGNKWFKPDDGGLLRYNNGEWRRYKTDSSQIPTNKINYIHWFDSALWLGTDTGLIKFKDNQWDIINTSNSDLPNDTVTVVGDDNSRLHAITRDSKISIMVSAGNFTSFSNPNLKHATSTTVDGNSVIWITTPSNGITNLIGNTFTNYNVGNSNLINDLTNYIAVDHNDHKWIGTFSGISVFKETPINLSAKQLINASRFTVYPNPATDYLKLQSPLNGKYEIYSIKGELVASGEITDNKIETWQLQKSTYVLVVRSANSAFSTRFIKE